MLESVIAVPFYWLGIPLSKALPIVTTFLSFIPFVALSALVFRRRSKELGILLLLLLFTFPLTYDLVTTLSRGFVTGIFLASGSVVALFYKENRIWWCIAIFSAVVGYTLNPNSVIVSIPCLFCLYLYHFKNIVFYSIGVVGVILGGAVVYELSSFYTEHPNYIMHGFSIVMKWDAFQYGIAHLDNLLRDTSPIFWKQGWIPLLICILLSINFFRTKKPQLAWIFLLSPLLVLVSMSVTKVYDGGDWVFFPMMRMFIGLPLIVFLGIGMLSFQWKQWYWSIALVPIFLVMLKVSKFDNFMKEQNWKEGPLKSIEVEELNLKCKELKEVSTKYKIELIIIENDPDYGFLNYACEACDSTFPKTLFPVYERRTWRLLEDEYKVYKRILFVAAWRRFDLEYGAKRISEEHPEWHVLENNQLPTQRLLNKTGIHARGYHVFVEK